MIRLVSLTNDWNLFIGSLFFLRHWIGPIISTPTTVFFAVLCSPVTTVAVVGHSPPWVVIPVQRWNVGNRYGIIFECRYSYGPLPSLSPLSHPLRSRHRHEVPVSTRFYDLSSTNCLFYVILKGFVRPTIRSRVVQEKTDAFARI